jgi:DtxR family Mn-dependent transcriptional regulator
VKILRKKTIEDYVEIIHDLQKENKRVHTNDVAKALKINPASVTEIFQKLSYEGYIDYEKYSGVSLTQSGRKIAIKTKNKHDKIMEFLVILGIDRKIAEKDACEMEHILHPKTVDTVVKFVEIIKKCEFTPFWLERLKNYIKTGKVEDCPSELAEICAKYSKN